MKNKLLKIGKYIGILCGLGIVFLLLLNFFVLFSTKDKIISPEQASLKEDFDAIVVLGAGIWGKEPSPMLEDRLLTAISLYKEGKIKKIIMSGDHGSEYYNEVRVMKNFAIKNGIPSEDIFMDHAGFSSYDSMYRAKEIFGLKKIIIVTQKYHLYRSLYIAKSLGLEAYGVSANLRKYSGQTKREIREIMARNKDILKCIIKPHPTYLGESISIFSSGDLTN